MATTQRKEYRNRIELVHELALLHDMDMNTALNAAHCVLQWDDERHVYFYLDAGAASQHIEEE